MFAEALALTGVSVVYTAAHSAVAIALINKDASVILKGVKAAIKLPVSAVTSRVVSVKNAVKNYFKKWYYSFAYSQHRF